MKIAIITGSSGLVGSEAVRYYTSQGWSVIGIDNDMRRQFFGGDASSAYVTSRILRDVPAYEHRWIDVRHVSDVDMVFARRRDMIGLVIHAAGQPSHDWAADHPREDFDINATGTLNVLDAARKHCPDAPFVFLSTNKVYGDWPNRINPKPQQGFDESLPLDNCEHSIFGVSKVAADLMVQEYGRRFGMKTMCLRCGCLTGAAHAGTKLHGYLSYLVRCAVTETPYTIIGHYGQQVRDNLHACNVVSAIECFRRNPDEAEFYNLGGGPENACTLLQAVEMVQQVSGKEMQLRFDPKPRRGDHAWWVTDTRKFREHYPEWEVTCDLRSIIRELVDGYSRKATDGGRSAADHQASPAGYVCEAGCQG